MSNTEYRIPYIQQEYQISQRIDWVVSMNRRRIQSGIRTAHRGFLSCRDQSGQIRADPLSQVRSGQVQANNDSRPRRDPASRPPRVICFFLQREIDERGVRFGETWERRKSGRRSLPSSQLSPRREQMVNQALLRLARAYGGLLEQSLLTEINCSIRSNGRG